MCSSQQIDSLRCAEIHDDSLRRQQRETHREQRDDPVAQEEDERRARAAEGDRAPEQAVLDHELLQPHLLPAGVALHAGSEG